MSTYQMNSHAVTARRIDAVLPLVIGGDKMLAPDAGIVLRLDDGTRKKWLAEPNAPMPKVGDWLVSNQELHLTYVVNPEQFQRLFEAA